MSTLLELYPKGTKVKARKPFRDVGLTTGSFRRCQLEGCGATRMAVRWRDGHITWICPRSLDGNNRLL